MDPNDTPEVTDVVDDTATPDTATPEAPAADDPIAAMDAGIAEASDEPAPAAEPAAEGVPGDAGGEPAQSEAQPEAIPPGDVEAEVTALGLKERSAERFRELSGQVAELAPLRDELVKFGIKDAAGVAEMATRADAGQKMVDMIRETGTTAEAYGEVMDFMAVQNEALRTGDARAARAALDRMRPAMETLARIAGQEVGGFDPAAAYPDLQAEVASGDLTAARAREIAAQRDRAQLQGNAQQQAQREMQAQQERQAAEQRAYDDGRDSLNSLDERLKADPAYASKRPQLLEAVQRIVQQHPPSQWASEAAIAYAAIAAPAPAAPVAPVGPVRGVSRPPALTPQTDDPYKAMDFGIQAASAG